MVLPDVHSCDTSIFIGCYSPDVPKHSAALIVELCALMENSSTSEAYVQGIEPFFMKSNKVEHTILNNGVHCYYKLGGNSEQIVQSDAILTVTPKAWLLSADVGRASSFNESRSEGKSLPAGAYFVTVTRLGSSVYLDCPSLDTHLHKCHLLDQAQLSQLIKNNTRQKGFYLGLLGVRDISLSASLHRDRDDLDNGAVETSNLLPGVPLCTCLGVHAAFSSLTTFEARDNYLDAENCVLSLTPTALGEVEAVLTEAGLAHDGLKAISRRLVDMVEDFLPRLEFLINADPEECALDLVSQIWLCLYVSTRSLQTLSMEDQRCTLLHLGRQGQGSSNGVGHVGVTSSLAQRVTFMAVCYTVFVLKEGGGC